MNCVLRNRVCASLIVCCVVIQNFSAGAKDGKFLKSAGAEVKMTENVSPVSQFQWADHKQLSWEDFKGDVRATNEESAAATHCGIGFKTQTGAGNKMSIIVYNTFYAGQSWVKKDAKLPSILAHEQGHFDLCEIYTRKLRDRLGKFEFNTADVKKALMNIYTEQ